MDRTDAPGNVSGAFVEPDEQTGVEGTEISAKFLNNVEESIVRTIEAAGLTPADGTDSDADGYDQLPDAVRLIAGGAANLGKNVLVNGGFTLWQRATSSPPSFALADVAAKYTADRWRAVAGAGGVATVSRVDLAPGAAVTPRAGRSTLQWAQSTAGTSPRLGQRVELLDELAGQKVTLSFSVLSGAGSKDVLPYCRQSFGAGGSTDVEVTAPVVTAVNTGWTRFEVTFDVPAITGATIGPNAFTEFGFEMPTGLTFGLAFSAVQVEVGAKATAYAAADPVLELERAMRYCQTTYELGVPVLTVTETGVLSSDDDGVSVEGLNARFRVPMRVAPALVFISPRSGALGSIERPPGADAAVTAVLFGSSKNTGVPQTSGVSAGVAFAHYVADAEL